MNKEVKERIISILRECSWQKICEFNYENTKGVKSHKLVEVYDLALDKGKFWGYDLKDQQLKQFNIESIRNYIEPKEEFTPRYEKK